MAWRQRTGSTVCPGCGSLVGVNDDTCYSCGRHNPALWGFSPLLRRLGQDLGFVNLVTVACVGLYLATLVASENPLGASSGLMNFLPPDLRALFLFGASGATPVFDGGRWWTVLSAGWLHGSLLHIAFNMYALRQVAPAAAEMYGPGRTVIIYTVGGIAGFLLSSTAGHYLQGMPIPLFRGANWTIGASAPIMGLLGALLYYGHRSGSSLVRGEALRYAVIWFLFGVFMPGVDNYAHLGGFAGGYVTARWLDPLTRERVDHLVAAFVCLALTALAIGWSLISGIQYLSR
jgi:membrane associated rhomboid family serine protease